MATRNVQFTCAWSECGKPNQRTVETHYWAISQDLPSDTPEPLRFVLYCDHCRKHSSVDLQSGESCRIGERLKARRESAEMIQRELTTKAGFKTPTVVAFAERGEKVPGGNHSGRADLTRMRQFSREVESGSRKKDVSKQTPCAPFRFTRNGRGSGWRYPLPSYGARSCRETSRPAAG